jgi:hypothetical protein
MIISFCMSDGLSGIVPVWDPVDILKRFWVQIPLVVAQVRSNSHWCVPLNSLSLSLSLSFRAWLWRICPNSLVSLGLSFVFQKETIIKWVLQSEGALSYVVVLWNHLYWHMVWNQCWSVIEFFQISIKLVIWKF